MRDEDFTVDPKKAIVFRDDLFNAYEQVVLDIIGMAKDKGLKVILYSIDETKETPVRKILKEHHLLDIDSDRVKTVNQGDFNTTVGENYVMYAKELLPLVLFGKQGEHTCVINSQDDLERLKEAIQNYQPVTEQTSLIISDSDQYKPISKQSFNFSKHAKVCFFVWAGSETLALGIGILFWSMIKSLVEAVAKNDDKKLALFSALLVLTFIVSGLIGFAGYRISKAVGECCEKDGNISPKL